MGKEKICAVCHSPYSYCPVCGKDKDKPTWMFTFCSQNCHDIYEVTSSYANKELKASEAKKRLDKLNLSQLNNFGESYQTVIANINSKLVSEAKVENVKKENISEIKNSPKKKWVKSNVE